MTDSLRARARASAAFLVLTGLLAGCAGPAPSSTPAAPGSPTAPTTAAPSPSRAPTAAPSPTPTAASAAVRPSLPPGAPAIADPYWLLATGTATGTWKDADGNVTRTDTSNDYTVIEGGSLEGTILVNGEDVALFSYTVSVFPGGNDPGTDEAALLELVGYGGRHGAPTPTPDGRTITWARMRYGTVPVVLRTVDQEAGAIRLTQAFWWTPDHAGWYQLSDPNAGIDLAPILEALLGAPAG